MKNIWLILLVIVVVLFVIVEFRKDCKFGKKVGVGKGKGGNKRLKKKGEYYVI